MSVPEFFFESEQLALHGNADYMKVLKALVTLEAQLVQATQDIDKIADLKRSAADDPIGTARRLISGELTVPTPIEVAQVPEIDLLKYDSTGSSKRDQLESTPSTSSGNKPIDPLPKRTKALWTKEEQRRLEDLLVEYPTEKVEMQRFAKIAKALGTRTTIQVASRCQKYFRQLYLAGLPVPGRLPKSSRNAPFGSKFSKTGISTSFFPEFDVPVRMNDEDMSDEDDSAVVRQLKEEEDKNVEIISQPSYVPDNATFNDHITSLLVRLRYDKLKDETERRADSVHRNFSCFSCAESPINGTRWLCQTCSAPQVNFCTDCLVSECVKPIDLNQHPVVHPIVGLRQLPPPPAKQQPSIRTAQNPASTSHASYSSSSESDPEDFFMDEDYSSARINSGASYLDPNYPATR